TRIVPLFLGRPTARSSVVKRSVSEHEGKQECTVPMPPFFDERSLTLRMPHERRHAAGRKPRCGAPSWPQSTGWRNGGCMTASTGDVLERARTEKTPLISGEQATFVWTGNRAPVLAGDMTGWKPWEAAGNGQRMEETAPGVWTCTLTLPSDAYVEYIYLLD